MLLWRLRDIISKIRYLSYVEYFMNQKDKVLFTVRHTPKLVYWCMSQYSWTHHIITKVKHILKWRNINYIHNYYIQYYLFFHKKWIKQYVFSVCVHRLNYPHGKTTRRITRVMYSLICLAFQKFPHYLITCNSFRKTFLNLKYVSLKISA